MQKIAIQVEGTLRNNIGDVLQGVAVADNLNGYDLVADREDLLSLADKGAVLLVANGWYMHDCRKFPPPCNVAPLYVSVHFSTTRMLDSREKREHFRKHAPVGARDLKTLVMLRAAGIPSYYSSCFTLGIRRRERETGVAENVLVVDGVDHPLADYHIRIIERNFEKKVTRISHDPLGVDGEFDEYVSRAFPYAEKLLRRYCQARAVITTKIHCALPCIAMGVPVVLIHPNPREERLKPVRDFIKIWSLDDLDKLSPACIMTPSPRRLSARKKFITNFLAESIRYGENPIRKSRRFFFLKCRAHAATWLWNVGLRGGYALGFMRGRLSKVLEGGR